MDVTDAVDGMVITDKLPVHGYGVRSLAEDDPTFSEKV